MHHRPRIRQPKLTRHALVSVILVIASLVVSLWAAEWLGDDQPLSPGTAPVDDLRRTVTPLAVIETAQAFLTQVAPPSGDLVIYVVAPAGTTGAVGPVGCGDYLVPLPREPYPPTHTQRQVAYALMALLAFDDDPAAMGDHGSALAGADLSVATVEVYGDRMRVDLAGVFSPADGCELSLAHAQIVWTVRQFTGPEDEVRVFLNGLPLAETPIASVFPRAKTTSL